MTKPAGGKLNAGYLELPSKCDVCGNARGTNKHKRCSKIRQQRHAEDADRAMMFDKKEDQR